MFQIIGIVVLFATVFGSFIMTGGKIGVVLEAAPHELMAILGAGIAAFLISNSMTTPIFPPEMMKLPNTQPNSTTRPMI